MRFSLSLIALVATASAAPLLRRQGAGVGQGCDAVFSDTDTMVGESVRGQGKDAAGVIDGQGNARRGWKRQGAGVGQGCDAVFADTDTMVGESVRGQGKDAAQEIDGAGGNERRQLNGIADGVTAVTGTAPGAGGFSDNMDTFLNNVDGQGTEDSAEAGEAIGDQELAIGQSVGGQNGQNGGGTAPPPAGNKRQLNGIADGVTAVTGTVPGAQGASENQDTFLNNVDGDGTQDSAEAGEAVGDQELAIGQSVGGQNGQNGGSAPPPPGN